MKISEIILAWYKKNKRDLPWRRTRDPYRIWISEIILQQTRVSQGLEYYLRFLERFPDIRTLALADEQEVLRIWQGLGYYSRARNLHEASKQVMENYGGKMPDDYESLLSLKGIGPYTAAAVASISGNKAVAVLDGNVARVLSRLYAIAEPVNSNRGIKILRELAQELMYENDPGEYNQAIMEFGALFCVPRNPACLTCPLNGHCEAYKAGSVDSYPFKQKKISQRDRYFTYFIVNQSGYTYINKRTKNDIWRNLYEFPCAEHKGQVHPDLDSEVFASLTKYNGAHCHFDKKSGMIKHLLTHQRIFARFVHVDISDPLEKSLSGYERIPWKSLQDFPLPRLIERYLEELV